MSKPKVRVAVSLLIGLVIVLAVFASVQAAASRASLSGERAITTAGLLPDTAHVRSSGQGLAPVFDQSAYPDKSDGSGGCERDNYESPDD